MTTIPPVEHSVLPDGSIVIRIGDLFGTVSSGHLVEPKVNQLKTAWLNNDHRKAIQGTSCEAEDQGSV